VFIQPKSPRLSPSNSGLPFQTLFRTSPKCTQRPDFTGSFCAPLLPISDSLTVYRVHSISKGNLPAISISNGEQTTTYTDPKTIALIVQTKSMTSYETSSRLHVQTAHLLCHKFVSTRLLKDSHLGAYPISETAPRSRDLSEEVDMTAGTILIILLILLLVGALPAWPHSRSWGYYPSGGLGFLVLILVVLLLVGVI
jgi:hypothetical protein